MDDWTLREVREGYASNIQDELAKYIPRRYQAARLSSDLEIDFTCSWYIFGLPGRGKTHTAYAVQRKRIVRLCLSHDKGSEDHKPQPFLIENVAELVGRAKCMELKERKFEIGRLSSGQDLILDDIGSENISEFSEDFLFQIINHRHDNLWYTGFTSNFNIGELPYDPRIKSRIAGMVGDNRYEMKDDDMRMKQSSYIESKEARELTDPTDFEYMREQITDPNDDGMHRSLRPSRLKEL